MNICKRNHKILFFSLFILSALTACEKNIEYEKLTGQLIGYVRLYENNWTPASDYSGVEITVEGSNPEISVLTDEKGQYIIDDLESGIYNIIFNKEGYGQYIIFGYQFVGGNKPATLGQKDLYQLLDFQIVNLQISEFEDNLFPVVNVTATAINSSGYTYPFCRCYLGDEQNVSYKNYVSSSTDQFFNETGDFSFTLYIDTLKFPTGSELFLVMYPATEAVQYYTDIESGKKIYTSVNYNNPSNVANITIPEF